MCSCHIDDFQFLAASKSRSADKDHEHETMNSRGGIIIENFKSSPVKRGEEEICLTFIIMMKAVG